MATALTTSNRGLRKLAIYHARLGAGTAGFGASENARVAVCILPGTEMSFAGEVAQLLAGRSMIALAR